MSNDVMNNLTDEEKVKQAVKILASKEKDYADLLLALAQMAQEGGWRYNMAVDTLRKRIKK